MEAKTLAIQLATKVNFTRLQTKMAALEHGVPLPGKFISSRMHMWREIAFLLKKILFTR
jgi:hypothetical protein